MQHIASTLALAAGFSDLHAGLDFAQKHGINVGNQPDKLERLQRVAAALKKNPNTVHSSVPAGERAAYFQLLYEWSHLLAVCLADLQEPAKVPAFHIRTFGTPIARPPLRLSPAHKKFVI